MRKINFLIICLMLFLITSCTTTTSYKVTFKDIDGNIIETKNINSGESLYFPAPPKVEGYKFIIWEKDSSSTSNNIMYNATYERLMFKVVFYDLNNEVLETQEVYYGETAKDPSDKLELNNYLFLGWDKDFTSVKSNLDVKPLFDDNKYSVQYFDENGKLLKEEVVNYGENVEAPIAPTKEGYTFIGWSESSNNVTNDLKIYPNYEIITFIVRFYDEVGLIIDEQIIEYGKSAKAPTSPTKEGYTFKGWDEKLTNIKQDLEVYPVFEEITFSVTFLDIYSNVIEIQKVKQGETAVAPDAPIVDYYTFTGWDKKFNNVTNDLTIRATYQKLSNNYSTSSKDYWLYQLSNKYDIRKELMSQEQITGFNEKVYSDASATKVKNVLNLSSTVNSTYVKNMIDSYTNINKYTIYNNSTNQSLTSAEKTEILNNRNYNNVPSSINVKYGVITDFAWMRTYPTNHYSNNYSMDRFQETTLNVGEGVAIYHTSLDGNWYLVQAENYFGWVEKKHIAECSYDLLEAFLNPADNIVVISDYVLIENKHVRMGQSFPLVSQTEDTYTINFPIRNSSGNLELKEISVYKGDNYSLGYLKYNYYNVYTQAFKLLGIDYSWGDKDKYGRDCSSTMNAIYRCFGFVMPRNTSNQNAIPTFGSKVSGVTNSSIQNYKPGSMIFSSGHVMLYIGENASGEAYILHNTTSGNGACILQALNSFGGSRIIGVLKMQ